MLTLGFIKYFCIPLPCDSPQAFFIICAPCSALLCTRRSLKTSPTSRRHTQHFAHFTTCVRVEKRDGLLNPAITEVKVVSPYPCAFFSATFVGLFHIHFLVMTILNAFTHCPLIIELIFTEHPFTFLMQWHMCSFQPGVPHLAGKHWLISGVIIP